MTFPDSFLQEKTNKNNYIPDTASTRKHRPDPILLYHSFISTGDNDPRPANFLITTFLLKVSSANKELHNLGAPQKKIPSV